MNNRIFYTLIQKLWICFFLIMFPTIVYSVALEQTSLLRIVILPFVVPNQADLTFLPDSIYDMIETRITSQGKVRIIDKQLVQNAVDLTKAEYNNASSDTHELALKIGIRLNADYVLVGDVKQLQTGFKLTGQMIAINNQLHSFDVFCNISELDVFIEGINRFVEKVEQKLYGSSLILPDIMPDKK
ncbi:MAG: hypothetical protein HQK77_22430 [Desulfobacterales bacterium]|nr:hypothetical protein [Desulfobacterales bacterium]